MSKTIFIGRITGRANIAEERAEIARNLLGRKSSTIFLGRKMRIASIADERANRGAETISRKENENSQTRGRTG
jgi:hypothetical protein